MASSLSPQRSSGHDLDLCNEIPIVTKRCLDDTGVTPGSQGRLSKWFLSRSLAGILAISLVSGCSLPNSRLDVSLTRLSFGDLVSRPSEGEQTRRKVARLENISRETLPGRLPPIDLSMTPEVLTEIERYLKRHRVGLEDSFARRAEYREVFEAIFRDEGLPVELLALPIIESGFNPTARSPVGARGLWQFMPATARHYGLVVNRHQDQRLDPILSTLAAARFLRDLYQEHGDWYLALAAYNAGSGGVNRAMNRAGARCYWQLARTKSGLTQQTKQFVPKFIAAAVIASRWDRYDAVELAFDRSLLYFSKPAVSTGPDA